ncbi:MAG: hypothetical protein JSR18_14255 [Proteobacteria bacterium]|nr:hypothetical protein [Pseudomonadota bacterium]
MSATVVALGWVLVWLAGAAIVDAGRRLARAPSTPGIQAWVAGSGFFVGAFLVTLWMRVLSLVGVPFGALVLGLPAVVVLVAWGAWRRRQRASPRPGLRACADALLARGLPVPARIAWCVLLAWLAVRFVVLWMSVVTQPLYPWDAWIQWATKARVWYELRRVVPFVDVAHWLAANGAAYTDAAPGYPGTVPLWQAFSATLAGRWDDALINVPAWFVAVALIVAVYGYLRGTGFAALGALAGAMVVGTLPLLDIHVALGGYADLPMAAYYAVAAMATLRFVQSRSPFDAGVALLLAIACPLVKTPGIVWGATLVVPLVVGLLPRYGLRIAGAGFAAALLGLLVLAQTSPRILNYQLHLEFAPPWSALFDSLFMLGSWNILWYGVVAAALLGGRRLLRRDLAPATMLVAAGVLFLFIVFAFTNARAWVETQTTVNRALLHLAPLLAVWMMAVFRARFADAAAPVAPAAPIPEAPAESTPTPEAAPPLATASTMTAVPPQTAPQEPPPSAPHVDALRQAARGASAAHAEAAWHALLAAAPGDPEALFGLGNLAMANFDYPSAIEHFTASRAANPRHYGVLTNLGLAYERSGHGAEAEEAFRAAFDLRPTAFASLAHLAQNLYQQKRYADAIQYYDRLGPEADAQPALQASRAICLAHVGRAAEGEALLQQAIRQAPGLFTLRRDLALMQVRRSGWSDAVDTLAPYVREFPDDKIALLMLDGARAQLADWTGIEWRESMIAALASLHSTSLPPIDPMALLYWTDDPFVQQAGARNWAAHLLGSHDPHPRPAPLPRTDARPLRIGLVSADFMNHPVTRLVLGLVERLPADRFALYGYAVRVAPASPLQDRLRRRLAAFRDIVGQSPAQQADIVRADGIDVLIDLSGYTGIQAFELLAQRPAWLQVNYLGYTGTLGSPAVDAIVTDAFCVPAAMEGAYDERPLRIEPCYLPSDPMREFGSDTGNATRAAYALPASGTVFGAMAGAYKVNPEMFGAWMRILAATPGGVLWLRGGSPVTEQNFRAAAAARGVDPARILFAPTEPLPRYFARWRLVDVMLDTYPFGAHTTVNDALFAGVPVITRTGRSFASRASASQLHAIGLGELVASTCDEYEALAVALGNDPARVAALRAHLAATRGTAPLFDMDRYAAAFGAALDAAWSARS